jgi:phosphatidylglycerol:prolipoprotein diacylglycerol transferase
MYPILFHIGSYGVHTYGVVLMIAFVLGVARTYRAAQARKQKDPAWTISPDDVLDLGILAIVLGIIGARLLFVIVDWDEYRGHIGDIFRIWEGGVSFHGSLIGFLAAVGYYCWRRKKPFLEMMDLVAPGGMLAYAIGRIGCFFNGCCYGCATAMPWGVRFWDDGRLTVPSHPTQLYSTAISLVFFGLLVRIEKTRAYRGQVFCWYILFSAVERFIMEIWRADVTSSGSAFGLTQVQWLCIGMFLIALAGFVFLRARTAATRTNEGDRASGIVER